MTYEMNVVYIWQNMTGRLAPLNGTECMVTGPRQIANAGTPSEIWAWPTDASPPCEYPGHGLNYIVCAEFGDLRRKRPPTGELSIISMFDLTAPAPREVEVA